jgi:hypothetical protein
MDCFFERDHFYGFYVDTVRIHLNAYLERRDLP